MTLDQVSATTRAWYKIYSQLVSVSPSMSNDEAVALGVSLYNDINRLQKLYSDDSMRLASDIWYALEGQDPHGWL